MLPSTSGPQNQQGFARALIPELTISSLCSQCSPNAVEFKLREREICQLLIFQNQKKHKKQRCTIGQNQVPVEGRFRPWLANSQTIFSEPRRSDTESSIMKRKLLASSNRFINRLAATGHPSIYARNVCFARLRLFTTSSHVTFMWIQNAGFGREKWSLSSDPQSTPKQNHAN